MGAEIEATIRITVTTIIISRSEKPSGRLALLALVRCVRRPIDAISMATPPAGRIHRDKGRRDVCAARLSATLQVRPCNPPRMARGQGGSLLLPCTTFSFATPCRFIPALSRGSLCASQRKQRPHCAATGESRTCQGAPRLPQPPKSACLTGVKEKVQKAY